MNRIYNVQIDIRNKNGFSIYSNYFFAYSLDEAIDIGKHEFIDYYNNNKPRFSKISFDDFMKKLDYYFFINIISGNRIQFKSYNDLKLYLETHISNISNDELYDFLLSLIDHMYTAYDYKGNLIESDGIINIEDLLAYDIKFTEEDCKNREYKFGIYSE